MPLNLDLLLFVGLPLIGTFIVLGIILMLIHFKHKKKMDSLHVQEHHLLADEGIRAQQVGDSTLGVSFILCLKLLGCSDIYCFSDAPFVIRSLKPTIPC